MAVDSTEIVGIRELRQHASRYVDEAAAGKRVPVAKRGQVVAYLVPAIEANGPLGELIAAGVVAPAEDGGDILDLEPVAVPEGQPTASVALRQMRDDERW